MTFFGITEFYMVLGYVACFLTVVLCCAWAIIKRNEESEDGDE